MNNLQAANDYLPAISIQVSEYAPLANMISWRSRVIFGPWAGHGSTAEALRPCGATVINNDFNPMYQTEMCEDALESYVYQCARDVTATVATTTMTTTTMTTQPRLGAPFVVVTSPWFQLLDMALPIMASCAYILFVQVPIFYIAQGPSPRMQWLRRLGDCGRLHIIAGDVQRNRTTRRSTLWLAIFRDNELQERELRAEWRHSVASIHFHTEACAGDQHH
eukprot:jgi/Tetstr1/436972/TSEL_025744.t1